MIQVLWPGGEFYVGPFSDEAEAHAYAAEEGIEGYTVEPAAEAGESRIGR